MGFMQQMKDLKTTVAAAPAMIQQSQELAANAQQMQMAYAAQAQQAAQFQAAAAQPLPATALAPIDGVDLATYAWVSKQVAHAGYDQTVAPAAAAQKGIAAAQWQAAAEGWAARMTTVPGLGTEFRRLFDAA
jgi:hypothetical protein